MRITLKLQGRDVVYDKASFVAQVFKHDSKVSARFFFPDNDGSPLQTGAFQLSQAEALQLAAALIAVAGGYVPEHKKACFYAKLGEVGEVSIGS
ncbi:hypothetical protein [Lysobacter hankyongensis]|uniref:Uncharacterized protein n=1 Tax=Lysobacter hankyongensis TaxID=1176535 RepID=A0ABP9C6S1_9GAMM